ncbi:MAG: hypothetical protein ACFFFK_07890, partial [Candidatus Thorarchaeota archaeon]
MNIKKSARLGFAAAIWLVLSVAVFGTLIGIAWISMNASADVSTDAYVSDSVDDGTTAVGPGLDPTYNFRDRGYWPTPTEDVILHYRDKGYYPTPDAFIGPGQNPIAVGHLR